MNNQVLKHNSGKLCGQWDTRYTVSREFMGQSKLQHILRFCGDYVSSHKDRVSAVIAAKLHKKGY